MDFLEGNQRKFSKKIFKFFTQFFTHGREGIREGSREGIREGSRHKCWASEPGASTPALYIMDDQRCQDQCCFSTRLDQQVLAIVIALPLACSSSKRAWAKLTGWGLTPIMLLLLWLLLLWLWLWLWFWLLLYIEVFC
mgnify:CR=1 FL=1